MPDIRLAQADFQIPRPQGQTAGEGEAPAASGTASGGGTTPSAAAPAAPANAVPSAGGFLQLPFLPRPVSSTEIAAGAGVFAVLLAVFFVVKLSVTRGLQARYAAPGPASEAGWLLFAFLSVTTLTLIAAYIGELWQQYVVVGPAAGVALLLLVLFVAKRSAALKSRR